MILIYRVNGNETHACAYDRLGRRTGSRKNVWSYFSQPRWRKYRNGAIALTTIRPSDQP